MIHLSLKNNIHDNVSKCYGGEIHTQGFFFWGATDWLAIKNEISELFKMLHSSLQHPNSYRS